MDKQHTQSQIASINKRIVAAWLKINAEKERWNLWQEIYDRRRELFPSEQAGGKQLRELELQLLRTDVAEAEALLGKFDEEMGNGLVLAEFDGIIDRIDVALGAIVDQDMPLLTYFDPTVQWVTAYVTPDLSKEALCGRTCRLFPEDSHTPLEGMVSSMGFTRVPCPPQLPEREGDSPDLRVPVHIDCDNRKKMSLLRPNMRVRVVFSRGRD
jgi:hypothetical protein